MGLTFGKPDVSAFDPASRSNAKEPSGGSSYCLLNSLKDGKAFSNSNRPSAEADLLGGSGRGGAEDGMSGRCREDGADAAGASADGESDIEGKIGLDD